MSDKTRFSNIVSNRKARHNYEIIETFEAGISLRGTEVKSLRAGKANIQEAYGYVEDGEVFVKGMNISEYHAGSYNNHEPQRTRKLLLKKREIRKLTKALDEKGLTLIPLKLYFNERNLVKMSLGLGRGKKLYDKRHDLKEKVTRREMDRQMKF